MMVFCGHGSINRNVIQGTLSSVRQRLSTGNCSPQRAKTADGGHHSSELSEPLRLTEPCFCARNFCSRSRLTIN